ncbi:hypothetical protein XBFFL1_1190026 [Xenorhabdus bovienii str. feltiae Florida]|uniref:Uncharacterized protein n=1 Tax=Xenorhabdus bovienii TaxID=40576 RepID=A0A0B6X9E3_XENBV|nr:hypothetical protein XBFFR1_2070075 [Xenorhabdus bovienii str. feltiae France]CDG90932.1 hypothetical protein XBFFL1_1190026 [Xenorhabdus bovienii str. feltiae Florida]CDM90512.1 conserved protein of unknown function [Xenorhabdus bovienii]
MDGARVEVNPLGAKISCERQLESVLNENVGDMCGIEILELFRL